MYLQLQRLSSRDFAYQNPVPLKPLAQLISTTHGIPTKEGVCSPVPPPPPPLR